MFLNDLASNNESLLLDLLRLLSLSSKTRAKAIQSIIMFIQTGDIYGPILSGCLNALQFSILQYKTTEYENPSFSISKQFVELSELVDSIISPLTSNQQQQQQQQQSVSKECISLLDLFPSCVESWRYLQHQFYLKQQSELQTQKIQSSQNENKTKNSELSKEKSKKQTQQQQQQQQQSNENNNSMIQITEPSLSFLNELEFTSQSTRSKSASSSQAQSHSQSQNYSQQNQNQTILTTTNLKYHDIVDTLLDAQWPTKSFVSALSIFQEISLSQNQIQKLHQKIEGALPNLEGSDFVSILKQILSLAEKYNEQQWINLIREIIRRVKFDIYFHFHFHFSDVFCFAFFAFKNRLPFPKFQMFCL